MKHNPGQNIDVARFHPPVATAMCLTCDEGGDAPANQVVEAHGPVVDVAQLAEHAVGVQALQEQPGEGAQVEEVQQDGDARARELEPQEERQSQSMRNRSPVSSASPCRPWF